ncbi:hypothetical protein [Actinomadura roseirufa]|uniref:hypothetical protein n=1 Tax=Actinomadura roseirufa TaxID=2094049 RepID=UPI0010418A24|nr:hypothetical protein [Actinomadura roseirufa]
MTVVRTSQGVLWAVLTAAANTVSWQAALITLVTLLAPGVMRLLLEGLRRRTFALMLADMPEGTVVEQRDGPGGRSMKVTMGPGRQPPTAAS